MPLTEIQKSGVRRHLGYPVIGLLRTSPGGGTLGAASAGWRYNEAYGFLEYKLNNLNPDEEARLNGTAYGSVILVGPQPQLGDTFSVTFTGGGLSTPQTIRATAYAANSSYDNRINVVNALAGQVSLSTPMQAAGYQSAAPYGTGPFSQNAVAIPEVGFTNAAPFTLTCAGSGSSAPQVSGSGGLLPPSVQLSTRGTPIYGYVPILDALETAYGGASQNLDTAAADVWKGRMNELGQRRALYETWVDMLSQYLGIPRNVKGPQYSPRSAMRWA